MAVNFQRRNYSQNYPQQQNQNAYKQGYQAGAKAAVEKITNAVAPTSYEAPAKEEKEVINTKEKFMEYANTGVFLKYYRLNDNLKKDPIIAAVIIDGIKNLRDQALSQSLNKDSIFIGGYDPANPADNVKKAAHAANFQYQNLVTMVNKAMPAELFKDVEFAKKAYEAGVPSAIIFAKDTKNYPKPEDVEVSNNPNLYGKYKEQHLRNVKDKKIALAKGQKASLRCNKDFANYLIDNPSVNSNGERENCYGYLHASLQADTVILDKAIEKNGYVFAQIPETVKRGFTDTQYKNYLTKAMENGGKNNCGRLFFNKYAKPDWKNNPTPENIEFVKKAISCGGYSIDSYINEADTDNKNANKLFEKLANDLKDMKIYKAIDKDIISQLGGDMYEKHQAKFGELASKVQAQEMKKFADMGFDVLPSEEMLEKQKRAVERTKRMEAALKSVSKQPSV